MGCRSRKCTTSLSTISKLPRKARGLGNVSMRSSLGGTSTSSPLDIHTHALTVPQANIPCPCFLRRHQRDLCCVARGVVGAACCNGVCLVFRVQFFNIFSFFLPLFARREPEQSVQNTKRILLWHTQTRLLSAVPSVAPADGYLTRVLPGR